MIHSFHQEIQHLYTQM